jgi:hypothetical protein
LLHDLRGPVLLHGFSSFPVCRHHITTRGDAGPIASWPGRPGSLKVRSAARPPVSAELSC